MCFTHCSRHSRASAESQSWLKGRIWIYWHPWPAFEARELEWSIFEPTPFQSFSNTSEQTALEKSHSSQGDVRNTTFCRASKFATNFFASIDKSWWMLPKYPAKGLLFSHVWAFHPKGFLTRVTKYLPSSASRQIIQDLKYLLAFFREKFSLTAELILLLAAKILTGISASKVHW